MSHRKQNPLEFINTTVKSNQVVIFSKTYCPFCAKAKKLILSLVPQSKVTIVELDQIHHGSRVQHALGDLTGASTVPRIFINHVFIGGCSDIIELDSTGQLKKLLA